MEDKTKSYYLIGAAIENLRTLRSMEPPTLRQILQNFIFYHSEKGETIRNAASSVIKVQ